MSLTRTVYLLAVLGMIVHHCTGDTYMHFPRGSNNRLNERSANRNNANRLFDSQNNNRGGYNAGDTLSGNPEQTNGFDEESEIYYMRFFQSSTTAESRLTIEWTNQHGCGGNEDSDPHKLNCNMVIQYMVSDVCDPETDQDCIRNGVTTNTQDYQSGQATETYAQFIARKNGRVRQDRGLHETFDYYDDCYIRSRQKGLFLADQQLRRNSFGETSAIYTRQNPNGNRRGYECPEERDYYPYWHPTPWRDIAILADNASQCDWYRQESFNVQPRGICRERYSTGEVKPGSFYNTQDECETSGGYWFTSYAYIDVDSARNTEPLCTADDIEDGLRRVWAPKTFDALEECLVLPPAPDCEAVGWTRVNHLGNGREGVPLNYTWTIPYFPSGMEKLVVVRIRYNISTDDYDPFNTNSSHNQDLAAGIQSPVTQNPYVNIGASSNKALRLAINTAQFGRTFQDRSHVMRLLPRTEITHPAGETCTIYNLNVRGKRGNIVQVYPSVEYDFFPNRLQITEDDCLHIQWTGSNTHNNGNPGGDGQTGDAGEGTGGTDRHNLVEIAHANANYPLPSEQTTMFNNSILIWKDDSVWANTSELSTLDIAVAFASGGHYGCYRETTCDRSLESYTPRLQRLLNNAPPSFTGAVLKFRPGTYHYICSRNNNFTNRSQKGVLTVSSS